MQGTVLTEISIIASANALLGGMFEYFLPLDRATFCCSTRHNQLSPAIKLHNEVFFGNIFIATHKKLEDTTKMGAVRD